ncbi:hypothetical protein M3Y99_01888800 [Aphelenchoides fujianensis]|nr:hypothetical protein M3Y99_01888800 [Aphelenchoides fujianensis]
MAIDSTVFIFGLVECVASTVLYGSAFVPLKGRNFGDGVFSLQIRTLSIMLVGLVTFVWTDYPPFHPTVMIGGMLWTIGNLIALRCVGELGLGMTVLLYSLSNCLTNWACGNFGLFGTKARPPHSILLNYVGVLSLLIGGVLIAFIKPESVRAKLPAPDSEASLTGIVSGKTEGLDKAEFGSTSPTQSHWVKGDGGIAVRWLLLRPVNVVPAIRIQDTYEDAPQDGISYVFSHFSGVFCTSTTIMFVYCVVKKNRPFVNPEIVLPSFLSGGIWAGAQTLFIHLSQSVSGPIGSIFPLDVRFVVGTRNMVFLCLSTTATLTGASLIALSKQL